MNYLNNFLTLISQKYIIKAYKINYQIKKDEFKLKKKKKKKKKKK